MSGYYRDYEDLNMDIYREDNFFYSFQSKKSMMKEKNKSQISREVMEMMENFLASTGNSS